MVSERRRRGTRDCAMSLWSPCPVAHTSVSTQASVLARVGLSSDTMMRGREAGERSWRQTFHEHPPKKLYTKKKRHLLVRVDLLEVRRRADGGEHCVDALLVRHRQRVVPARNK